MVDRTAAYGGAFPARLVLGGKGPVIRGHRRLKGIRGKPSEPSGCEGSCCPEMQTAQGVGGHRQHLRAQAVTTLGRTLDALVICW